MEALIGLSPIIFFILLITVIIVIIKSVAKKSKSNSDLERRIGDLEEEVRNLKDNRGM
jgi:cell division protein FtsB